MVELDQELTVIAIEQPPDGKAIDALVCETPEGEQVRFTAADNSIFIVDELDD